MKPELKEFMQRSRREQRELDELLKMREKVRMQAKPDQKVLAMLEDEIAIRQKS